MMREMGAGKFLLALAALFLMAVPALHAYGAQRARRERTGDEEFGPIVRAYLAYLRDQQEVVDDRASRHEVDRRYYTHNSNRIRALRQMAVQLARQNDNDYLPELEAVTPGEFDQLFFDPLPKPSALKAGEVLESKLRFLGAVVSGGEKFYLFARLDPYEQAELMKATEAKSQPKADAANAQPTPPAAGTRPRRINPPLRR